MQTADNRPSKYFFYNGKLPLAIYRELVAHLRQVDGVQVGLLSQTAKTFDYRDSQISGLWLEYPEADAARGNDHWRRQRVDQILAHYSDRFGAWESTHPETVGSTM